jgi:hypothetical protein
MRKRATRGTSSLRARLLFARLSNNFTLGVESQFVPACGPAVGGQSDFHRADKGLILKALGEVERVG